ncbi:MAG: hypothetical protein OXF65_14210 [Acidimicrobiaceae bacterium]|nr:hypothetical protein [Acidimicrobiaceae bacterium]
MPAGGNDYPLMVGSILSPELGENLKWVHLDQTVGLAETMMMLHKYSQLPVFGRGKMPRRSDLKGMVTWESIARARLGSIEEPELADALADAVPQVVGQDMELFRAIPMILDAEAVLVEHQGKICSLITPYDLTEWLADVSEPFFALSEIEALLRCLVDRCTDGDTPVRSVRPDDAPVQIDDLSMGDCIRVLEGEDTWLRLGTHHDRATVVKALNEARKTRNRLMHGREYLTCDAQRCRNLLDYLRALTKSQPQVHEAEVNG